MFPSQNSEIDIMHQDKKYIALERKKVKKGVEIFESCINVTLLSCSNLILYTDIDKRYEIF